MEFHVINLGCKVNRAESDTIAARFLAEGHKPAALEEARVIIVNTCTVTGEAEKKTRKAIRRALRANPTARLLVTGCAVVIDPDSYRAIDSRVSIVHKTDLVAKTPVLRIGELFPKRVSVKVQDGCDHACTYCIVHVARGKATSRAFDEVLAEVRAHEAAGVREIVLSGIDLGSYRFNGGGLAALLERLLAETSQVRFRVSSVEPCSLTDDTIELIARAQGRICRHLHIPLQSGSSKVLAEMARPYDAGYYADLIEKLYRAIPSLSLSTDIIAGFPGETDEEFAETIALAEAARFSKIHAFPYSKRAGTPAALRNDQIAAPAKEKRLHCLLALGARLRKEDACRRIGTTEDILVEEPGIGTSESYYKVKIPRDIEVGSLCALSLTATDSSCIMKACKKN